MKSINWREYREELISSLANERLWALGSSGSDHYCHLQNMENIEEEISLIDSSDYETVLSLHRDTPGHFDDYLIKI